MVVAGGGVGGGWGAATERVGTSQDLDDDDEEEETGADAAVTQQVVPGMTLCVESYVGEVGGPDGVKLEEQVLVTESGVRLLSHYAFDEALLR